MLYFRRSLSLFDRAALSLFVAVSFAFWLLSDDRAIGADEKIGSTTEKLVQAPGTILWTNNSNHIPMCWHQLLQFPNGYAENDARAFVVQTIQDGWINRLNLTISWVECPTSGTQKHVRVMLRIGDARNNGTTLKPGMATLSTSTERTIPPPNDPPGLLMGFRSNWKQNNQTQAAFRSLILHEFGHVLGFDHEQRRPDGPPGVSCYTNNSLPGAITLGPADPQSIMGWSYCQESLGVLTPNDISAAQSIYGVNNQGTTNPCPGVSAACAVTEMSSRLLLLN